MAERDEQRVVAVEIHGRVQGVGYRDWCVTEARGLKLAGWVRNRREGHVEAVFRGRAEAVEAMLAAAWNGPRWANVEAVTHVDAGEVRDGAFPGDNGAFERRPTL